MKTFSKAFANQKMITYFEITGQFARNCIYALFWEGKGVLKPVK